MTMFRGRLGSRRNKSYEDIPYSCTIRFLDDTDPISVTYQKDTRGQWLIDHVCRELNLLEKDYFGLRYVDAEKQRHWLDPWKPVHKQLKHVNPMVLCFRVKFYPTDPMKLKEEITRYYLFLQLRRDLHHGRLLCSPADANLLAAYIIQSEVGDFDPQDHQPGYVAQFKMLPKQTTKQEEKIADIHKGLSSLVPSDAEGEFLRKASALDTYGVDPHPVKQEKLGYSSFLYREQQKGNQMYLGVTHLGIVTFQGNKRTHLFKWPQITKIVFEGKMFIVHVTISEGEENSLLVKRKKHACGFKCPTYSACKHLWKCAIEQQYFFTLQAACEAPKVTSGGGLFTRGSKFRFSGRCQKEVYQESSRITRDEPSFMRSVSNPQLRASNTLRSASLPSRLKSQPNNIDEVVVVEPVLAGSLSMEPVTSSTLNGSLLQEVVAEEAPVPELPDQTPVILADLPYDPLESPAQEEPPPFPAEPEDAPDLDTQIQHLQLELEKCKSENSQANHAAPPAPPAPEEEEPPPPAYEEAAAAGNHHGADVVDGLADAMVTKSPEPQSRSPPPPSSGVRAVLGSVLALVLALLVLSVLVLEPRLDLPLLRDLRQLPEVQQFSASTYSPLKAALGRTLGWNKT